MSNLSVGDKALLEGILGMRSGYVLDFSNASFSVFFGEFGIDIYDNQKYPNPNMSESKANRLRAFWKSAPNNEIKISMENLADYIDARRIANDFSSGETPTKEQIDKIREIASKLDTPIKEVSTSRPIVSNATVDTNQIQIEIRSEIYTHIKTYLDAEDYFHAVDEAYKVVRQKLFEITDNEKATEVFNMNAESSKYHEQIFGYVAANGTPERDFLRGVGYLQLAVQFLRNEKSHTLASGIDKNLALHYISLASLSFDLISRRDN